MWDLVGLFLPLSTLTFSSHRSRFSLFLYNQRRLNTIDRKIIRKSDRSSSPRKECREWWWGWRRRTGKRCSIISLEFGSKSKLESLQMWRLKEWLQISKNTVTENWFSFCSNIVLPSSFLLYNELGWERVRAREGRTDGRLVGWGQVFSFSFLLFALH